MDPLTLTELAFAVLLEPSAIAVSFGHTVTVSQCASTPPYLFAHAALTLARIEEMKRRFTLSRWTCTLESTVMSACMRGALIARTVVRTGVPFRTDRNRPGFYTRLLAARAARNTVQPPLPLVDE